MFDTRQRRRDRERDDRLAAVLAGLPPRPEPKHRIRKAATTARSLAFRLRRQLAPLAVMAGLWIAGAAIAHTRVPAPAVLLLGLLAAVALWRLRYTARLDRPVERRYAVACLAGGVVWLTLVAALGLT